MIRRRHLFLLLVATFWIRGGAAEHGPETVATPPAEITTSVEAPSVSTAAAVNAITEPPPATPPAAEKPLTIAGTPIESLLRLGQSQAASGNYEGARTAFFQVLQSPLPPETEVEALLGLSSAYLELNERTRAVAILERLIKDHAASPQVPRALLKAGRIHRDLGAERLAMSRFYAVLQATLRIPDDTWAQAYKQLARTAQYEIAETHLRAGRYDDAERYFARFSRLELTPEDQARGAYKVIEARSSAGRHEGVIAAVNAFIDQYPLDPHVPAALHHGATALRELGRADDALAFTLRLLQASREQQAGAPAAWSYWQRRTGNELANTFFQRGEFRNARQIYDTLAGLDPALEWSLPAIYQGALCRERLGQTGDAIKMYRDIVARAAEKDSKSLQEISDMAAWRIDHLESLDQQRADIRHLLQSLPTEAETAAIVP